jgi:hypothetical protein
MKIIDGILNSILIVSVLLILYMKLGIPAIKNAEEIIHANLDGLEERLNLRYFKHHEDYIHVLTGDQLAFHQFIALYDDGRISDDMMAAILRDLPQYYLDSIEMNRKYERLINERPFIRDRLAERPPYVPPGGTPETGSQPARPVGDDMILGQNPMALNVGDFRRTPSIKCVEGGICHSLLEDIDSKDTDLDFILN